jgi:hypothetical protein
MRWLLCCVWLVGCSLDTTPRSSATDALSDEKLAWTPRVVMSRRAPPPSAAGSSAPTIRPSTPPEAAASPPPPSAAKPAAASPPAPPPDAATPSADTPASAPVPDAAVPTDPPPTDAGTDSGVEDLLDWLTFTTVDAQRMWIEGLVADLDGTRRVDREALVAVLRGVEAIDCRGNAALCLQLCVWAASRCDVCDDSECNLLMQLRCGADCGPW